MLMSILKLKRKSKKYTLFYIWKIAFVLITKLSSKIAIIPYFWLPSENLRSKSKKDYVSYEQWIKDGFIRLTPGNVIDYAYIQRDILEICRKLSVEAVAFDRWMQQV